MTIQSDLAVAKEKLASVEASYQAVKADIESHITALEAEVAALPAEIAGKADSEMVAIYHKIVAYFGGETNVPPAA